MGSWRPLARRVSSSPAARTCPRLAARSARRRPRASCSSTQPDSPRAPRSAKRGACRVAVVKRRLPCPPRPPRASTVRWPPSSSSTRLHPGPHGLGSSSGPISRSPPRAPWRLELRLDAALGPQVLGAPQGSEVATRGIADQDDVTMSTVASIGAAKGTWASPRKNAAVAAAPTLNPDLRSVIHRRGGGQEPPRRRRRAALQLPLTLSCVRDATA